MIASIIIPCYNYGKFLHEAISSALSQTFDRNQFEVIVINDGSDDNTVEIAKNYPIKLISQERQGLSIARNRGIAISSGHYILPLDADDMIHKNFLEKTVPILDKKSSVGVVYTHRQHFGLVKTIKYADEFNLERMKIKCSINYCSLFRKTIWEECNGYNSNMNPSYEDWDFWLNIAKRGWKFELIREVLFYYRKHGHSLSDIAKENHSRLFEQIKKNHSDLFSNIKPNV